jgi:hypothetical protein
MSTAVRRLAVAAALLALSAALGCSFSNSSESFSDSSKSSSDSSDSSGGSDSALFESDVEDFTVAYVSAGGQREEDFLAALGDLARERGVSDWEAETRTWEAIGRGLGRSELRDAQLVAYREAWAGGDPARAGALARGLDAAR